MALTDLINWFAGGSHPYHTLYHCMAQDSVWVGLTVGLDLTVAAGYVVIAGHWRKTERSLRDGPSKNALGKLKTIFIFCGLCGYIFIPIKMFWPAWRLYDAFMICLAWVTWRYAWSASDLKIIYSDLSASQQLAVELEMSRLDQRVLEKRVEVSTTEAAGAKELLRHELIERERAQYQVLELNKTLEGRNEQLELANKELESFSYSVSHDLRAPLRSIEGFSQALLEDCQSVLPPEGQDHLRRVREAVHRMDGLIEGLLNLSRVTRTDLHRNATDLSGVARKIVAELTEAQPQRHIDVVIADGLVAQADSRLATVILSNLLSNAWKFTAKNPHARVEFGSVGENGSLAYFVRDDGAGFNMAHKEKLFQAFQRLHRADDFAGSGIGLATVRRIVARHGGRVWAEGEEGKGAIFFFTL